MVALIVIVVVIALAGAAALFVDTRDKRGTGSTRSASSISSAAFRNRQRFGRRGG